MSPLPLLIRFPLYVTNVSPQIYIIRLKIAHIVRTTIIYKVPVHFTLKHGKLVFDFPKQIKKHIADQFAGISLTIFGTPKL